MPTVADARERERVRRRALRVAEAEDAREAIEAVVDTPKKDWVNARCTICKDPSVRERVDRWRAQGMTYADIAENLADLGIHLSREGVRRHCKNHIDPVAHILQVHVDMDADAAKEADAERSDLERLTAYIERATRVERALSRYVHERIAAGESIPMSISHAWETVTNGLRQAIQLRARLQEGTPSDAIDALLQQLWLADVPETPTAARAPGQTRTPPVSEIVISDTGDSPEEAVAGP